MTSWLPQNRRIRSAAHCTSHSVGRSASAECCQSLLTSKSCLCSTCEAMIAVLNQAGHCFDNFATNSVMRGARTLRSWHLAQCAVRQGLYVAYEIVATITVYRVPCIEGSMSVSSRACVLVNSCSAPVELRRRRRKLQWQLQSQSPWQCCGWQRGVGVDLSREQRLPR